MMVSYDTEHDKIYIELIVYFKHQKIFSKDLFILNDLEIMLSVYWTTP